ncbi:MAG: DsbA family protein, partial [Anaerolineae bacterium]|nr:DsbA family protein [Anaerolineae bacterium]
MMTKNTPVKIDLYADLHCPYAYLTAYRLRQLRDEYAGKITIVHRCLSLEYINRRPTPKTIINEETPILMLAEPEIPYRPWKGKLTHWPVTMWPAVEAVKCAEKQGPALANDLDWAIRKAFFAENQCISMRHVLLDLARDAGLDLARFTTDFDDGVTKRQVLQEAQKGWEELKVEGSPTFVLPSGEQFPYLALPKVKLNRQQNYRATTVEPAPCSGQDCLKLYHPGIDMVVSVTRAESGNPYYDLFEESTD